MDEESFIKIINDYYNFRDQLTKNIENSSISMNNEDCYLIEESWHNILIDYFDKYDNYKKNNIIDKNEDYFNFIPELEEQIFINKFSSLINCLRKNVKMKLLNRTFFESIYEEEDLKYFKKIKYYSGNNKLIIEYKGNNENKALLLINPLKEIKAFIISITNEEKKSLFEKILSERNNFQIEKQISYNKNIISFHKYLNILKLFIYFYYYEKSLLENQTNIFNENDDYYLINPEWINYFKEYYGYSNFTKTFNIIKEGDNTKINYNNLKKFLNHIINVRNNLNFDNDKSLESIIKIEEIASKPISKNKILYFSNCYIINSEMMNLIDSIFNDKEINIKKRKIFIKYENIYLMYKTKIIIGKLDENLFIAKYILSYKTKEIFNSEKNYLVSNPIEEYIKDFNCKTNNYQIQLLKGENNIELGQLLILLNQKKNKDNKNNNFVNLNKNISKSTPKTNKSSNIYKKIKKTTISKSNKREKKLNDYRNNRNYNKLKSYASIETDSNTNKNEKKRK